MWNLSGHVVVRITNTNGAANAVVSGLFFGAGGALPANAASFVGLDTTTRGTWKGSYGAEGGEVAGDAANYPAYASVTTSGNSLYTWEPSTTDSRALQKFASTTDRIASCWFTGGTLSLDVRLNDANSHQVAFYLLDWDNYTGGRTQRMDVLDATTNAVLDTRSVSSFTGGQYLVWNISGHVIIRITNTNAAANAVISGIFFR